MPCSKVTITKNYNCDKEGCFCVPTKGESCPCQNETDDNTRCDCKCEGNKCICGEKCTCVNTGGYSCICVCRDEEGKIKTCEGCSCVPTQRAVVSCKGKACDGNCKCKNAKCICLRTGEETCICVCSDEKGNIKTCQGCSCKSKQRPVVSCKGKACDVNCKCENAKCICLSMEEDSNICVCSDEKGITKTCERCSCKSKQGAVVSCKGKASDVNCKCKNAKCICSSTKAASCICVCSDKGNIKTCEGCFCKSNQGAVVSCKGRACDVNCKCEYAKCICLSTGGDSCICVCSDEDGNIKTCERCSCKSKQRAVVSCKGKACDVNCKCKNAKCISLSTGGETCICVCGDEKGSIKTCEGCFCKSNQEAVVSCKERACNVNCKCENAKCICLSAGEDSCICICSSEDGNTKNCQRCSCKSKQRAVVSCKGKTCDVNCKFENAKCICLSMGGDSCICVCSDEEGNIKTCQGCSCKSKQRAVVSCKGKACNVNCMCENAKCICLNTGGEICICVCGDEKGSIKTCEGCSCKSNQGAVVSCKGRACDVNCKCENAKCICLSTRGASCICICTDEKNNIMTCGICSCAPYGVSCKGKCALAVKASNDCKISCKCDSEIAGSCICENKQEKFVCCDDCKCDDNNKCDKKGCVCCPKSSKNCNESSAISCICVCKNGQEKRVCCDDCKCDKNNICDKKGCACCHMGSRDCSKPSPISCIRKNEQGEKVWCDDCKCDKKGCFPKGLTTEKEAKVNTCISFKSANSCICVCENKQGKLICCNGCKCDDTNTCDKIGCVCISKSNISIQSRSVKANLPRNNCCWKPSANVCVCKQKQEELVCCNDCKCDHNNTCEKKSCTCVPKESVIKMAETAKNTCVRFKSVNSSICLCENNEKKLVCSEDCKCDTNKSCNKEGCACVFKGSTTCIQTASLKTMYCCKPSVDSCVCVCENKQRELVCCDDCKCNTNNRCDKQNCSCVTEGSVTCVKGCTCASKRLNTCICSNENIQA